MEINQMLISRLMWDAYLAYHLRGQAEYPFKPLEAIKRAGNRRVRLMVEHAYRHVPYYRETMDRLGLRPSEFRAVEDLSKLPLLGHEEYQHNHEHFVSTAQRRDKCLRLRTGGSTGVPRTVYHDARALFQSAAHGERKRSIIKTLAAKAYRYRETLITHPFSSAKRIHRFYSEYSLLSSGVRIHRQFLSMLDSPEKNARLINKFKPDVVQGYGSYLEILFPVLADIGSSFHLPRVVIHTSDMLSGSARNLIEKELNILVLSTYQAVEAFEIGFECEYHQGFHLNVDLYPVRIVDAEGRTLEPGDSGEVVISNLVNRATVLLNYRIGDIAALLPGRCTCGRSLPLLSLLEGRTDDWIELASGRILHPQAVHTIVKNEEKVWQYQVVQKSPTCFTVKLVAASTCDRRRTSERLANKLAQAFGDDVTIDVSFVDSIDRTPGGKVRPILSMRSRLRQNPACSE